jgi:uncharacterized membrane protein YkvA (DUF1232 family)
MAEDSNGFASDYADESFWGKVVKFAKAAGKEVIEPALQLYYALQEPATPVWAKTVIVGALGYFISPIDAIPDLTPIVGYADDLGVLVMAVATVAMYITDDIKAKASEQMHKWFGED